MDLEPVLSGVVGDGDHLVVGCGHRGSSLSLPLLSQPSGRADPLVGAVGEHLTLPHRQPALDLVHQVDAGIERLPPVRAGRGGRQRDVAHPEQTDPMRYRHRDHPWRAAISAATSATTAAAVGCS